MSAQNKIKVNNRPNLQFVKQKMIGGFPDRTRTTLRYCESIGFTSTSGVPAYYTFRGNGPFDPDQTGTGAQPANYDDFSLQYNRVRCYGSRIKVYSLYPATTTVNIVTDLQVLGARHTTSAPSSLEDEAAMPYSDFVPVGLYSSPNFHLPQTMNVGTAEFLGIPLKDFTSDDDTASLVTTLPVNQWYWQIGLRAADGSSTANRNYFIIIDYDLEFYDRNETTIDSMALFVERNRGRLEKNRRRLLNERIRASRTQLLMTL